MALPRWLAGLSGAVFLATMAVQAEQPAKTSSEPKPAATSEPQPEKSPATSSLSTLKLPDNAIIVLAREVKDALGPVPYRFLLTPEQYQALQDRIAQLERQVKPNRPDPPSECKLSIQVEGERVHVQAQYKFSTSQPRTVVALGSQHAWARGAALDGHVPLLLPSDDEGLVVQVDQPGAHQLSLEMESALSSKGAKEGERGFEIGLPRAAITTVEQVTLAGAVPEVRLNGRGMKTKPLDPQHQHLDGIPPLGAADHLEVTWKDPVPQPQAAPLLSADTQISVQVDSARLTTVAEITLQVLRGEIQKWRIQVPPQVVPEVKSGPVENLELPDAKNPVLTIKLKEASAEPVQIVLRLGQVRPEGPVSVGPFTVLGTSRQQGTIVISAPTDLRLRYHPHGDVSPRDIPEDRRGKNAVAAFTCWNVPPPANETQLGQAPLDLEVETVKGSVETRVSHDLFLEPNSGWRITTRIEVTPIRMEVDHLDVDLPPDYHLDQKPGVAPAELVENPVEVKEQAPQHPVAQIKLAQPQAAPFTLTLAGWSSLAAGARQTALGLPTPLQTLDRGGQATGNVPEGLELFSPESGGDLLAAGTQKHTWRFERAPPRLELGWRPPELAISSQVDVVLSPHEARVHHHLRYKFSESPPNQVSLLVPEPVANRVEVLQGGTLTGKVVTLRQPASKDHILELFYTSRLPDLAVSGSEEDKERHFSLPLVRPEQGTHVETKVRVWSDPGLQPAWRDRFPWTELPAENGPAEQDSLPGLVLSSTRLDVPASLTLDEREVAALPGIVVNRALIQVTVNPGGQQTYRARFLVSRLMTRSLDVDLPAPAAALNPEVFLGSKKVTSLQTFGDGSLLRVGVEPDLYRRPLVLEIRYQMGADISGKGPFRTVLEPPVLKTDVFLNRVRWQVDLPGGWVNLYQGGGYTSEQRWEWQGGLWTPRPSATSADLERWLTAQAGNLETPPSPAETSEPGLVCWRSSLEPVQVVHFPQQVWLLICSVVFLAVALGISFAPLPRSLFWGALSALVITTLAAAIWWPSVLPALLYGCEPAAVVFVLVLLIQWLLQRRYRHQVVFLPGFSRLKAGSSMVRGGKGNRTRPEPPTAEVTPKPGAESAKQAAESSKH